MCLGEELMKFRTITATVLTAAAMLVGFAGGASAESVELQVSVFTPPINPLSVEMVRAAKEIEAKTNGRLKLNVFLASQMGPAPRQFDLVRTGVADISVVLNGLTPGRFPMTELAELPGLIRGSALPTAKAMLDNFQEYFAAEYPDVRVLNFAVTPNPIVISRMELRTIADFKGKRIRHPSPVHAATIAALGAVPVLVQPFELAEALARGQIDGALTGAGGVVSFKLQDSARYILDMETGGMTFAVVMKPAAYEKIPADLRNVFDQYFGPGGQPAWGKILDVDEANNRELLAKEGLKFNALGDAEKKEFNAIAAKLQVTMVDEFEKKGLKARAYFDKLKVANEVR
jgi:TRAP-type C4-dicarboxylate transport system substrate-binding protein